MGKRRAGQKPLEHQIALRVTSEVKDFLYETTPADRHSAWVFICALLDDPGLPLAAREFLLSEGNRLASRMTNHEPWNTKGLAAKFREELGKTKGE